MSEEIIDDIIYDHDDSEEQMSPELLETSSQWNITRNDEVEGNRMTYAQFAAEWEAAGIGRDPIQGEYENWMLWGSPGSMFAELSPNATAEDYDMGELFGNEDLIGTNVRWYGSDATSYVNTIEEGFDPVGDGEYVIVPTGTAMRKGSNYTKVSAVGEGYELYMNEEKDKWYESEWALYGALAVSLIFGGVAAGALAGALTSAAGAVGISGSIVNLAGSVMGGALVGGATSGTMAEIAGGDFMDGVEDGLITGGVTSSFQGVSKLAGYGQGTLTYSGASAAGSFTTSVLKGEDLDDSLISGGTSFLTSGISDNPELESGINAVSTLAQGGDFGDAIKSYGRTYIKQTLGADMTERFSNRNSTPAANHVLGTIADRNSVIASSGFMRGAVTRPEVQGATANPMFRIRTEIA